MEKSKNQTEQLGQAGTKKLKKKRKLLRWLILLLLIIQLILLVVLFWPYKKSAGPNCQNLVNEVPEIDEDESDDIETLPTESIEETTKVEIPILGDDPSNSKAEEGTNLENQQPEPADEIDTLPSQRDVPTPQIQNAKGGGSWGDLTNPFGNINPNHFFIPTPPIRVETTTNNPNPLPIIENSRHRPEPGAISSQSNQENGALGQNGQDSGLSENTELPTSSIGNTNPGGDQGNQENTPNNPNQPNPGPGSSNGDNSEVEELPEPVDLVNPGETSKQKKKKRGKQKKKKQPQVEPFEYVADEVGNRSYLIGFFDNRPHYHAARIGETYGGNGEITAVIFNITWEGEIFHVKLTPDKSNYYWHIKSYEVYEGHKHGTFYWNDKSIKGVVGGKVRAEADPEKIKTQIFTSELIHRPGKTQIGHRKYTEEIAEEWKAGVRQSRKENRLKVLKSLKIYLSGRTGASVVGS